MRFAVVAHRATETNCALTTALAASVESLLLTPAEALEQLGAGDVALARLDVRPALDGIERGLRKLTRLSAAGVRVLNPPPALVAAHDKLITSARLRQAGVAHPATAYVAPDGSAPRVTPPVVVKPRFGSWGRDVHLCESRRGLDRCLLALRERTWFRSSGAVVQELVPTAGYDLRVLVAAGEVVGGAKRVAAAGEWRTNLALGGCRRRARPSPAARALALAAADAVGGDLVGVDLLPTGHGGYTVIEVNGAVDFTQHYSHGLDVFALAADALLRSVDDVQALAAV